MTRGSSSQSQSSSRKFKAKRLNSGVVLRVWLKEVGVSWELLFCLSIINQCIFCWLLASFLRIRIPFLTLLISRCLQFFKAKDMESASGLSLACSVPDCLYSTAVQPPPYNLSWISDSHEGCTRGGCWQLPSHPSQWATVTPQLWYAALKRKGY